jgi:predicted acyltransferase
MGADQSDPSRIASLDQFRGYTVLGMFFVNFASSFLVITALFKHHHTYCSYADTIMPQFFLAVGFAYRLTLLRRLAVVGPWTAYARVLRRNLGLILLGGILYHLDGVYQKWDDLERLGLWGFVQTAFQREFFQTLVHIGVTAIWIMPVIAAPAVVRLAFGCFSAGLHLVLSYQGYYDWVLARPGIDGGPLGFLTWTIPMLAGSFAYDIVAARPASPNPSAAWAGVAARLLAWGMILMILGYTLSCLHLVPSVALPEAEDQAGLPAVEFCWVEPPFVPPTRPVNLFTMSQRAGSVSYLTFGAGFSLAVYALFVWVCEMAGLRLGLFTTLGSNALAAYIIGGLVEEALKPFGPKDAPLWYVLTLLALFLTICWLLLRHLEKNRLFLRL